MRNLLFAALLGCSISACNTDKTAALQQHLTELSQAMGGAAVTDVSKAEDFIKTSEALAALVQKTNPEQYVDLLLKAADLAKTIGAPAKAVELYALIIANTPQHPKAATAQFMTGLIYANDMNELDKAKAAYEAFLLMASKAMGGASTTDKSQAENYIKASETLAAMVQKTNPEQYVDLLLKAAGLAKTIEKPEKAIELYASILANAPQHPKAATAQFMTGFIYANDMEQLDKAKAAYETFLQKYPTDELAESAKMELENLGKSPEELIKKFEAQQQGGQPQ